VLTVTDLERLAHRVIMGAFAGTDVPDWAARLVDDGLGSVCIFGSNVASAADLAQLTGALHDRAPELLVATDEEGGDVTRLHVVDGSPHPGNAALGAVDDTGLTERVARSLGAELAAAGVDLDLAPVADANTDPANPVIGVRSFGADPVLVGRHTAAYVAGLLSAGVGACVKHFPGHGDTHVDSHHALPEISLDVDELERVHLEPFRAAVAAGVDTIMTAHIVVPVWGAEPATLNPRVLGMLRDWGFEGVIITDALDMAAIRETVGIGAGAARALAAGADLLCIGNPTNPGRETHPDQDHRDYLAARDGIVAALRDGSLPRARVEDALRRIAALVQTLRTRSGASDHAAPSDTA
jgi:beta-N-acetylhexosaminidase